MIHLIVGNTGAGKTTYATELKSENNGVVFSVDKWNKILFLPDKKESDGLAWFLERIDREEKIIIDLILQLENAGVDSILDLGFSKKEHRQKFTAFANEHNLKIKIHFLDIDSDTRLARVMKRNQKQGATYEFQVSKENFDFMEEWFEIPDKEEMIDGVIIKK